MGYKTIILSLIFTFSTICSFAAETMEETIDRKPVVHGVLRTRYEGEWNDADDEGYRQRFQVRNARVSLEGQLLKPLDWYIRVDLCDRGKMKFLDAWARWRFTAEWSVKMGQYRVPFGVDAFRAPGTYIFANRSFIGKQMANLRQVGLQVGYYGHRIPLTVEVGVFNSSPMSDHDVWQKGMDYAAKATLSLPANVTFSGSFLSMMPYGVRMNLGDASIGWTVSRLHLEAEYQHLHYVDMAFDDVNAWLVWANWAQPVNWSYFNRWNINARFDGMTNHSTGQISDNGRLICNDPTRRRVTIGSSVACDIGKAKAELMLDYEKYFYNSHVDSPVGESDKIVAELIVKF